MLIAQISDTHIVAKGENTHGRAPMAENLALVVAHINGLVPRPDVVVHSGDVTDSGTVSGAENALEILSKLAMPFHVVPGNHDRRECLSRVFGVLCQNGFANFAIDEHPVRLIGMDSTIPGAPGGELCEVRLAWLETELAAKPEKPTIIFMHHPPVKCGVVETDMDGFVGAERLGGIVERYASIERILCGHIHLPTHSRFHGTIISTAPSTGMRLGLDLTMTKECGYYLSAPAYQLHHWTESRNLISHVVTVDGARGPFLFE